MGFSVDTIVNLLTHTILHPLALISFLAYEAKKVQGWPVCTGYTTTAYYILALYAGIRLSNRWRNGLILRPRLNVHTWPEEIVLVTGGAQGIAKSVCEKLAKKGAKVAAVDIVQFKPSHPNIKAYKCDISKYAELEKVKTKIAKDLDGQVTMVANIAGLNNKSLILDLDEDRVSKMIDVNLKSHFWAAMLFLPDMVKRKKGHFLSVSSTMGYAGICHQSDYVATKHALVGMHESLYYEMQKMYKTPNVRTSIAIIGHTKTGLFDTFNVGAAGRFMAPLLEPDYVADLIVDAFESQESKQIFTPFTNHLLPGIKAYPSFLRDGIQALSGADGSYPTRPSPEQLNGGIVNGKGH